MEERRIGIHVFKTYKYTDKTMIFFSSDMFNDVFLTNVKNDSVDDFFKGFEKLLNKYKP